MVKVTNNPPNDDSEIITKNLLSEDFDYVRISFLEFKNENGFNVLLGKLMKIKPVDQNYDWESVDNVKLKIDTLNFVPDPGTVMDIYNDGTGNLKIVTKIRQRAVLIN